MTQTYKVTGMTCTGCAAIVHDKLAQAGGVKNVTVDLDKNQATLESDRKLDVPSLQQALAGTMYKLLNPNGTPGNQGYTAKVTLAASKKLVTDYITAVGDGNFEVLPGLLAGDFQFNGDISLHNANDFIKMLKDHAKAETGNIVMKNDIQAVFAEIKEAWVIYDVVTTRDAGRIPCMEHLTISADRIIASDFKIDKHSMQDVVKKWQNGDKQTA